MDKYDDMLLKARAEMLGQQPLRKAPPHDALFSHVWNHVIKAPNVPLPAAPAPAPAPAPEMSRSDQMMQMRQQRMNDERTQAMKERTQSSPPPADPFGQMNEGASLDGQTQGMGANFRQGRSETRDPNKTGMFGRAKQGIANLFRRNPSQQTESTPPSLQEESQETRAFRDMPRAEYPPSFRMATSDQRAEDGFPTRRSVVRNARAGSKDLAEWDRMNAIREQREAEPQAEQGNNLRAAMPSPMQEAQEMKTPVEAGMDAMREQPKVDDNFYDRFAGVEEQPMRQPQPEAPAPVEEQREFSDPFGQMNDTLEEQQGGFLMTDPPYVGEQQEELPPDFNTEIEPQHADMREPFVEHMREMTEEKPNWWDGIEGAGEMQEEYPESPTDLDVLDREAAEEERWGPADDPATARRQVPDADFEVEEQEERLTKPLPTGRKGVKGLLPDRSPRPLGEDRMLTESTGAKETGEMVGPPSKARTGFIDEVNNRSDKQLREQQPNARSKSGRLEQRERGEKRMAARSVDPTEATEKVLNPPKPKKAAPKKAKESPAAKAVGNTDKGKEVAEANKKGALEGTEEMREKAPKKGAAKVEATTSKKAPKMEIGEGAERIEAKPKKGASKVKETTSEAKPKKGSALARVNSLDEKRKAGEDPSKNIFANKAKPARKRTKNPKKTAIEGLGEAAARSRTRQAAKAKKNEPSEESAPEKEYGLSISGSASPDDISEIMEAARNGNKSAQSAIYNNAGTLEDSHGISQEEIDEVSGR